MKRNLKVYFVIVTYNNKDLVDECLSSIYNQDFENIEVVLVDNGSTDDTFEYVQKNHPKVHAINSGSNLGFAAANNLGIIHALKDRQCSYVALLNSDATLEKNWTKVLVNFAEGHENGACYQTPTLDYFDHTILDSRGIKVDRQGRAIQLGHREKYHKIENHVVFGVNAAACMINVRFLKSQGFDKQYFDEDMWMYLEDVDLAARSTITGWKNWYVNGSFAYHMGSASSGKNPGFSIYYSYRNNLSMLIKNMPFTVLVVAIFGAIVTDAMTLYNLLRARNKVAIKAIIKGRLKSILVSPTYIKKRRIVRASSKISKANLRNLMDAS